MIDVRNENLISSNGVLYCDGKVVFFDYKEDAKVFAKNLRKTKRFLLVRIKIKQKTEKSWKGKKFSPKFWYEIQAYGGK